MPKEPEVNPQLQMKKSDEELVNPNEEEEVKEVIGKRWNKRKKEKNGEPDGLTTPLLGSPRIILWIMLMEKKLPIHNG